MTAPTPALRDRLTDARALLSQRGVNAVPDVDRMLGDVLEDLAPADVRERAAAKGRRYLTDGRLTIRAMDGRTIEATCRGDSGTHTLGWHAGGWWCSCPARRGRCSHLVALRLVVLAERHAEAP